MISPRERQEAIDMRKNGFTYKEIAKRLGCTDKNAAHIVKSNRTTLAPWKSCKFKNLEDMARDSRLTLSAISEYLGITVTTLSTKLSGKSNFKKDEIDMLIDLFQKPYSYLFQEGAG